ncbi:MAG: PEP-CTERM sorting domain-containing protein [Burkholderiaceae bacterium]|nr:PEP-CTERM sorting domain-containing protein [Burkholderiaceae bacterium]
MFKIGVGDYNADEDHTHLRAWSASDVLLASADYDNPASTYGGDYMMVSSATSIAYVTFWDGEPYPGAVYWDNMSYTPVVPEPETYALMGLGLAALGLVARRRRQA